MQPAKHAFGGIAAVAEVLHSVGPSQKTQLPLDSATGASRAIAASQNATSSSGDSGESGGILQPSRLDEFIRDLRKNSLSPATHAPSLALLSLRLPQPSSRHAVPPADPQRHVVSLHLNVLSGYERLSDLPEQVPEHCGADEQAMVQTRAAPPSM
jgi:hypothetical protein